MPPDEAAAPGADAWGDDATLQLPLLGLYADLELGVGSVSLPDEFEAIDPARRLAILRDWTRGLERARARALRDWFDALARSAPALSPAAQRARFEQACAEWGIEPPDRLPGKWPGRLPGDPPEGG